MEVLPGSPCTTPPTISRFLANLKFKSFALHCAVCFPSLPCSQARVVCRDWSCVWLHGVYLYISSQVTSVDRCG
ncbi:hypothetical protein BDZ91DRAFT_743193 [Kalaharituber pfeilii]|nr:hypothetical protein BDZ91DRAFT_743193 [Kalaharituber pfeilii]